MRKLFTPITILVSVLLISNCDIDKNKFNSDDKIKYEQYPIALDTIFIIKNQKLQLLIKTREDLMNRQISETYQCEKEGLITNYGNEFILQLFEIDNNQKSLIATNYINFELIKKLDKRRKLENYEILDSYISFVEIKDNMCILSVKSFYPVGEGSNNIELGLDIMNPKADYCNIGGILLLGISSPYD